MKNIIVHNLFTFLKRKHKNIVENLGCESLFYYFYIPILLIFSQIKGEVYRYYEAYKQDC